MLFGWVQWYRQTMRRAALYCRVSTLNGQTTTNQELALREVADRMQCEVVALYTDEVSGAKGRDKRPGFDALLKAAARHEFDLVMAWSVDRLGAGLCGAWSSSWKSCGRCGSTFSCTSRASTPGRRP